MKRHNLFLVFLFLLGASLQLSAQVAPTTSTIENPTWYYIESAKNDAKSTLGDGGHWIQRFGITASGFCDFGNSLTGSMSNSQPINLGTPEEINPQVSTNIIIANTSIGIVKSSFVMTGGINGETGIIPFTSN